MVDFRQLRDAKPEKLRQAGQAWKEWAGKFEDRVIDFKKEIIGGLDDPGVWTGSAADAAGYYCYNLRAAMQDYADEPESIGTALEQAADDIGTHQGQLDKIVTEIRGKKDTRWRVEPDGSVHGPEEKFDAVQNYQEEINGLVRKADQTDKDCARKIQTAIEQLPSNVGNYTREEATRGRQAAAKLQWYLEHGKEPPAWLTETLRKDADDEYYATAFAEKMGAKGMLRIPAALGNIDGLNEGELKGLMGSVGELLGTATNGEHTDAEGIKRELVKAAGSTDLVGADEPGVQERRRGAEDTSPTFRKFWAMQKLLQYGEGHIEGSFLANVAESIYNHRDELPNGPSWNHSGGYPLRADEWNLDGSSDDPMVTALRALDDSPPAGREFFGADPNGDGKLERVKTLMNEYYMNTVNPEYGAATTEALKAASTEFEHVDPQRDTPAHKEAATIASNFLHFAAEEERGNDWGAEGSTEAKRDIASVMSFYYEDLQAGLQNQDEGHLGARTDELKYSITGFKTGANISGVDAKELLGLVWDDQESQQKILGSAALYADTRLQYQIEIGAAKPASAAMGDYGEDVGRILDAAYGEKLTQAQKDETIRSAGKMLVAVGAAATGPVGVGAASVAAGLSAVAGSGIHEVGSTTNVVSQQLAESKEHAYDAAKVNIAEMMLRRGLVPPEHMDADPEKEGIQNPFADGVQPRDREEFEKWMSQVGHGGSYYQPALNSFETGLDGKVSVS